MTRGIFFFRVGHLEQLGSPRPLAHPRPTSGRAKSGRAVTGMLTRKATRIDLKPEDREEYFAHKQEAAKHEKQQADSSSSNSAQQPSDKEIRIGLAKAR